MGLIFTEGVQHYDNSMIAEEETPKLYTLPELKEILVPVLRGYDIKQALLFGSYAKGTATPYSDIDLYVDSGLSGLDFFGLAEDVFSALSAPVDLVDKSTVTQYSDFQKEVFRTGVSLYDD